MTFLNLTFSLIPILAAAQNKTYVTIAFGKDFPKHRHVIGGYFTGNSYTSKNISLGGGTALLKFDNIEKFYVPIFFNLSYMNQNQGKKIFPVVLIQPGFGFYRRMEAGIETKGGFTFHTSAGIGYPFLFKKKGYATIGFAHYTFKTDGLSENLTSYGGRIGMIF
ncbi:MAG: hypothetical protein ACXWV9_01630 [Flavisolibacter sp.]